MATECVDIFTLTVLLLCSICGGGGGGGMKILVAHTCSTVLCK